mgnify:CR=1 FL=1
MKFFDSITNLLSGKKQFSKGLFVKKVTDPSGFENRIHLRVDPDGTGVLWVNASQTFYLNQSASLMSWCLINNYSDAETEKLLVNSYPQDAEKVKADYRLFSHELKAMLSGESDVCDLCQSGIDSDMPFSANPSAPYRMDLALTYGCNNHCSHCYNDRARQSKPLSVPEWKKVMKKIADNGIPHIVFTGGEPTLYPGLVELAAYAEELGLVSGMNTNGRELQNKALVDKLAQVKLDHIQITLESNEEAVHDEMVETPGAWKETVAGIQNAVQSGIFTMTNTTLLRSNGTAEKVRELICFLNELGVKTVGLNALIYSGAGTTVDTGLDEADLPPLLKTAQQVCEENGQQLIWYTPTQYCQFDPQDFQLGIKGCSAARYSMCVEPDGTVLPCQSWYEGTGNLLRDSWKKIWNHPLNHSIRDRTYQPSDCSACEKSQICGGGCPLAIAYKPAIHPQQSIPSCF